MSVLEDKAKLAAKALREAKFIEQNDCEAVQHIILEQFREGGNCQLLEGRDSIHIKTIVRNKSGKIIAIQG